MTKVEAIEKVLQDNGGSASLRVIYDNIEKYYPGIKSSTVWESALRGVLYRELSQGSKFKKIGLSIYALNNYREDKQPDKKDKVRMHSFMEGICIELGNEQKYDTYTADPSAKYRDNTSLNDITTLKKIPNFTYDGIIKETKLIDVLWFDKSKYSYPQFAFEIVDSISTLNGAINRCFQLINFKTKFFIIAPEEHRAKFEQTLDLNIYQHCKDIFCFKNYDSILETYKHIVTGASAINWLV